MYSKLCQWEETKDNVRGAFSKWFEVTSRVPQGSVVRQLLFLIYINDLPEGVESFLNMFADDAKVMTEVKSKEDCINLQGDLNRLQNWSDKWLVKFIASKYKVMRIEQSKG